MVENDIQIFVCISSNNPLPRVLAFFGLLVCFPFMKMNHTSIGKSRDFNTPYFTSLSSLCMDMCPNLSCHNIKELSFEIPRLIIIKSEITNKSEDRSYLKL